jgi:hypothetical protein
MVGESETRTDNLSESVVEVAATKIHSVISTDAAAAVKASQESTPAKSRSIPPCGDFGYEPVSPTPLPPDNSGDDFAEGQFKQGILKGEVSLYR